MEHQYTGVWYAGFYGRGAARHRQRSRIRTAVRDRRRMPRRVVWIAGASMSTGWGQDALPRSAVAETFERRKRSLVASLSCAVSWCRASRMGGRRRRTLCSGSRTYRTCCPKISTRLGNRSTTRRFFLYVGMTVSMLSGGAVIDAVAALRCVGCVASHSLWGSQETGYNRRFFITIGYCGDFGRSEGLIGKRVYRR